MKQERYEEAEELYRTMVELLARDYPNHAPRVLMNRLHHARAFLQPAGRLEEAERELLDIFQLSSRHYDDDEPGTVAIVQALVDLYAAWGRDEQALEWRGKLAPISAE